MLADFILPLPSVSSSGAKGGEVDEVTWTERLLNTTKYLTDKSINALLGLSGLKNVWVTFVLLKGAKLLIFGFSRPTVYEHFVEACIKNNVSILSLLSSVS